LYRDVLYNNDNTKTIKQDKPDNKESGDKTTKELTGGQLEDNEVVVDLMMQRQQRSVARDKNKNKNAT